MTISQSRLSYSDCYDAMDKALADADGVRIEMPSFREATFLRMRMHQARQIDRKDNQVIFEDQPDHQMYGRSVYDRLMVRIRTVEGKCWLYLQQLAIHGKVEALSEVSPDERDSRQIATQIAGPTAPLQIEHVKRRV